MDLSKIDSDSNDRQMSRITKIKADLDSDSNEIDRDIPKINGFSQVKEYFLYFYDDFPSTNYECFSEQLDGFIYILSLISSNEKVLNEFQIKTYTFIQETNFPNIIYSLIMNDTLDPISQGKILQIFFYLTRGIFSIENFTFIENEDFLHQLLLILQSSQNNENILNQCLISIINILQFYPNSFYFLNKCGISDFICTEIIKTSDMIAMSHASHYILYLMQQTTDEEQKRFLLHQTILRLNETMERRPLTFLLQIIMLCLKGQPDIRIQLVEENICKKCVEIILMMKSIDPYTQFYGDYSIQILSCISIEGSDHEFQVLLDSNVFEAFFAYGYSFLDISDDTHVDNDTYNYVCNFLVGTIVRNDPKANHLLNEYEIYQKLRFVFFNGPIEKRMSSLFVITKAVEINNSEMCQLILENSSLLLIFDMISTMNPTERKNTLELLIKLVNLNPDVKEKYIQNDLISKLEPLFLQQNCEEEEIKEIEILLNCVNEKLE